MKKLKLICTHCGEKYDIESIYFRCSHCNEPLELEEVQSGRINQTAHLKQTMMERYQDFFPFLEIDSSFSLGEGFTPLIPSRIAKEDLNINNLYFKNETVNPTWSFKDRGTVVGMQHAIKLGYKKIGTVSTGNMAVSVAAYGSRAGLETFVFVDKNIAPEKLNPIAIHKPHLIKVDGNYGDLYYETLEIGKEKDIYFINSDQPYRVEGSKAIAFEICEQLNFVVPDYVVVPTSAGGNIRGIEKGFREFKNAGLIDKLPKIICAQASGCSPIYNAFITEKDTISRIEHPNTIAHAIENPYPPSGNEVLRMVKKNDSLCVAVTDEEIIHAQAQLAKEGLFGQPASAVPLAAVKKLKESGRIKESDHIVCIVTGSGLKYTSALEKHHLTSLEAKMENLRDFLK